MIQDYENELREINNELDALKKKKDNLVAKIKAEHLSSESATYGSIQVVVSQPYYELTYDFEKLVSENAELCSNYQIVEYHNGTTTIKLLKGGKKNG